MVKEDNRRVGKTSMPEDQEHAGPLVRFTALARGAVLGLLAV